MVSPYVLIRVKRLMGASLLVFANKKDVGGSMSDEEIREVWCPSY